MVVSRKSTSPSQQHFGSLRNLQGVWPYSSPNFYLPNTFRTRIQNAGPRNASRSPPFPVHSRTLHSCSTSMDPVLSTSPPWFMASIQPPRNTSLASTPSFTPTIHSYPASPPRPPTANHPRSLPRIGRTTSLPGLALIPHFRLAIRQRMGRCSWIRILRRSEKVAQREGFGSRVSIRLHSWHWAL